MPSTCRRNCTSLQQVLEHMQAPRTYFCEVVAHLREEGYKPRPLEPRIRKILKRVGSKKQQSKIARQLNEKCGENRCIRQGNGGSLTPQYNYRCIRLIKTHPGAFPDLHQAYWPAKTHPLPDPLPLSPRSPPSWLSPDLLSNKPLMQCAADYHD